MTSKQSKELQGKGSDLCRGSEVFLSKSLLYSHVIPFDSFGRKLREFIYKTQSFALKDNVADPVAYEPRYTPFPDRKPLNCTEAVLTLTDEYYDQYDSEYDSINDSQYSLVSELLYRYDNLFASELGEEGLGLITLPVMNHDKLTE